MRIGNRRFYFSATLRLLKNKYFKKNNKIKERKIRIAFIVQELAVFNKSQILIDMLSTHKKFDVLLLCIPSNIENGKLVNNAYDINDTYEYCKLLGYTNLVNTLIGGKWINIEKLEFDYIFYNRPYDKFYPNIYKSDNVSKFTKICMLPYAFALVENTIEITTNNKFFRNVYFYFAESIETQLLNINRFWLTHKIGVSKSVYLGMPSFEQFFKRDYSKKTNAWNFSKNKFRAIWTPRWTTDLKIGGSNFFEYCECFLKYAVKNPNIDFLLRPHPLMFKNFIAKQLMTIEDVAILENKIYNLKNFEIDREKEYNTTFYESDVLITDISSIIPEYLIVGKPVILCKNNLNVELVTAGKKMLEACYCVNTFEQIIDVLEKLEKKEDPLKDKRERVIKELFGDNLNTVCSDICKALIEDFEE